jgi:hypothetical protein
LPARLRDIQRAAIASGLEVIAASGKHPWKARRPRDGKTYGIPAHGGLKTEITEVYIRGLCRAFDLDLETFRKLL